MSPAKSPPSSRHLPLLVPKTLPCSPCPHGSPCCNHGTTLTPEEASALAQTFGLHAVALLSPEELCERGWFDPPPEQGMWATTLHNNQCTLLQDNGCIAHNHPHYPLACKAFPHNDVFEPLPQASDAHLCPEVSPP